MDAFNVVETAYLNDMLASPSIDLANPGMSAQYYTETNVFQTQMEPKLENVYNNYEQPAYFKQENYTNSYQPTYATNSYLPYEANQQINSYYSSLNSWATSGENSENIYSESKFTQLNPAHGQYNYYNTDWTQASNNNNNTNSLYVSPKLDSSNDCVLLNSSSSSSSTTYSSTCSPDLYNPHCSFPPSKTKLKKKVLPIQTTYPVEYQQNVTSKRKFSPDFNEGLNKFDCCLKFIG